MSLAWLALERREERGEQPGRRCCRAARAATDGACSGDSVRCVLCTRDPEAVALRCCSLFVSIARSCPSLWCAPCVRAGARPTPT